MSERATDQDLEHLRLLSIFYYVVAGLAGLVSLFPIIHLVVGLGLLTGQFEGADPTSSIAGWLFVVIAGGFILTGFAFAVCLALTGRFLVQRRRYLFCLVMAAMACMFMPFGTVLGVFTIIVLVKEPVKALFLENSPPNAA